MHIMVMCRSSGGDENLNMYINLQGNVDKPV